MGTAMYTDAWSAAGRPLADDSPGAPEPADSNVTTPIANATRTTAPHGSIADTLTQWAEAAFGPAITGVGRELGAMARQIAPPGQIQRPWAWIGAAAIAGYALGRTNVLRPFASFAVKTALTTLVERALRSA